MRTADVFLPNLLGDDIRGSRCAVDLSCPKNDVLSELFEC